jgi:hypothetical protein
MEIEQAAAADRRGIGFGWLQNAWLLHARLKIHRGVLMPVCGQHRKPAGRFTPEGRIPAAAGGTP